MYATSGDMLPPEAECVPYLQRPVVVGLSGGRDSVALLCMLVARGCAVRACHVHHGIRAEEADADAAFCRRLCSTLGVELSLEYVDIPRLAQERGESLETAARLERRRILQQAAACDDACIALAHHADDQAETILFRLARGGAGLRGMRPVHCAEGTVWLRPLLGYTRQQITDYLQNLGQSWRDDATNAVPDVTRNRLRLEVLPAFKAAMGREIVPIINRSARLQAETLDALEVALSHIRLTDPQGRLYLPGLLEQPLPYRKAVIRHYLAQCGVPGISERLVLQIDEMLPASSPLCRLDLPGGFRALRRQKRLIIEQ